MKTVKAILPNLFLSLCVILFGAPYAQAALPNLDSPEVIKELKARSAGLISEAANRRLSRAQELASAEKYPEAIELLKSYLAKSSTRKNEQAQFLQNLGFIQAQKGDYTSAIKSLEQALETKQLPFLPTLSTQYALGQLYLTKARYKESVAALEAWFKVTKNPKDEAYVTLANAYSQLGNKKKALDLVETAISKSLEPKENWLLFALGLNFEMKEWKKCAELLEHLTAQNPSKGLYWRQLSGVYLSLNQNAKALASMELAYKQGQLENESEFINLAALYLDQGVPLKAAQVLEKEMSNGKVKSNAKNLEVIADAYQAARENQKALGFLEQASKESIDGKVFAKKGQLLLAQEKWKEAAQALREAIKRGKLSSPEQAHLGLGISLYHMQNYKDALAQFNKAESLNTDFRAARQWISFAETAEISTSAGL